LPSRTIDLHSHPVPCVDDGPATWEEARALLDGMAARMPPGSLVIATPHLPLSTGSRVRESQDRRIGEFLSFANPPGGSGPRVLAGREVLLDTGRPAAGRLDALCLPGTSWVLVELPPDLGWLAARRRVRSVIRHGLRPLLALPERYRWCRSRPERLLALGDLGAGIQVSARSLRDTGPVGAAARLLLETGLAHVVGSDAHSAEDPLLSPELAATVEEIRPGAFRTMTVEMPGRILDDRPLPPLPLAVGDTGSPG